MASIEKFSDKCSWHYVKHHDCPSTPLSFISHDGFMSLERCNHMFMFGVPHMVCMNQLIVITEIITAINFNHPHCVFINVTFFAN